MNITSKEELSAINSRHAHAVDKLYRMFAGLSSHLLSYEEGVITLQIHHSPRWPKDPLTTAKQLARCWFQFNKELRDAHSYTVYIHPMDQETGAVVSVYKKDRKTLAAELYEASAKMGEERQPDRVGEVFVGEVADLRSGGWMPSLASGILRQVVHRACQMCSAQALEVQITYNGVRPSSQQNPTPPPYILL